MGRVSWWKRRKKIEKIIDTIREQTNRTVNTTSEAQSMIRSQADALNSTIQVFSEIDSAVYTLTEVSEKIASGVEAIERAKQGTQDAIDNISAVAEETAACTEEAKGATKHQIHSVEGLSDSAIEMDENANRLAQAIQIFTI